MNSSISSSSADLAPRRYVTIVFVVAFALAGSIAVTNWLLDPYSLLGASRPPESLTEAQGAFLRASLAVVEKKPRTVIVGTSRAAAALAPIHPRFSSDDAPILNLALGAANVGQMRMLLVHAHKSSGLRKAIIGLDLEAFLGGARPDFDSAALRGTRDSEPKWLVMARAMASRDMLFSSMESATRRFVSSNAISGSDDAGDRFQEQLNSLQGQRGLFWITEFNNFYSRLPYLFPRENMGWSTDERRANAMRDFRALLDYARAHDIQLRMFVSPVHARYLEWYRRVGWWPTFENWKRALAKSLDEEANAASGRTAFTIWDFSGFHPMSTESVPRLGDLRGRMHWYWESSHYSRAMGDVILNVILGFEDATPSPLPKVTIDSSSIEQHLQAIRAGGERYRQTHPGETANVAEMVRYLQRVARK